MAKKAAPKTEKTKGILLIALGHANYGRLAYNLAVTIKSNNPDIDIALAHNFTSITHLGHEKRSLFSHLINVPKEYYMHDDMFCAVKSKTFANELSPFDCTLFIDSDVAMFPNKDINNLFDELKGIDFTIKNTGYYDCTTGERHDSSIYGYSAELPVLIEKLKPKNKIWQIQGEVFYFEKSASLFFKHAQTAFTKQSVFLKNGFAGCNMNDELAFIIAMIKTNTDCHQNKWIPSYWSFLEPNKQHDISNLINQYYFLSVGGHRVPQRIIDIYTAINSKAYKKQNLGAQFKFENKINYLPERLNF